MVVADGHTEVPEGTGTTGTGTLGEPGVPVPMGTTGIGTLGEPVPMGTTGIGTLGEPGVPVDPAWTGTGTTGVDGEGVATTGGPTKEVADGLPVEPASSGLGLGVTLDTATAVGVLLAGQPSTVGAQLVMILPTVLKAVASTTEAGAETCS